MGDDNIQRVVLTEVFCSFRYKIVIQLEHDSADWLIANGDVEVGYRSI
jgi:hypothetical protein